MAAAPTTAGATGSDVAAPAAAGRRRRPHPNRRRPIFRLPSRRRRRRDDGGAGACRSRNATRCTATPISRDPLIPQGGTGRHHLRCPRRQAAAAATKLLLPPTPPPPPPPPVGGGRHHMSGDGDHLSMRVYGGPCRFWLLENFVCVPKKLILQMACRKLNWVHSPF